MKTPRKHRGRLAGTETSDGLDQHKRLSRTMGTAMHDKHKTCTHQTRHQLQRHRLLLRIESL
jgi:hypothetical protein